MKRIIKFLNNRIIEKIKNMFTKKNILKLLLYLLGILTIIVVCVVIYVYLHIDTISEKFIFEGAFSNHGFVDERKINFFSNNHKLLGISTKDHTLKFFTKAYKDPINKNGILVKDNEEDNINMENTIPCILYSISPEKQQNNIKTKKILLVYFGCNGETIYYSMGYGLLNRMSILLKDLNKQNEEIIDGLIVGYPGYACSKDKATCNNFYKYSKIISETLNDEKIFSDYNEICLVSYCLGGAMLIDCAQYIKNPKVKHIFLINAFQNIGETMKQLAKYELKQFRFILNNVSYFLPNNMDNVARIKNVTIPKADFIFSDNDKVVNNIDSRILFNKLPIEDKHLWAINGEHFAWMNNYVVPEIILSRLEDRNANFSDDIKAILVK